jgi:hypothetical protein
MSITFNGSGQSVLQVQSATTTTIFSSSSGSFVDITGLSVIITPTSVNSKILILANVSGGASGSNGQINLVRNGTNICQGTSGSSSNATMEWAFPTSYAMNCPAISYLDSPATTSAVTYKLQLNAGGSTAYVNVRATDNALGTTSSITVMEISGS